MFASGLRKLRQLADDPVLRRWLVTRVLRGGASGTRFTPHAPPYLAGMLPLPAEAPSCGLAEFPRERKPDGRIVLPLAGTELPLRPDDAAGVYDRTFDDLETLLALHRFAWMPALGDTLDPAWVSALWGAWADRYRTPDSGWAWHPYTAAERAVNLLDFAVRHGLPGPRDEILACLAAHATAIAARLEYFGEDDTSNHLANNGRGLFLIGLALGLPKAADLGGRILVEEAKRLFRPSGMLREGSSHYHALYAVRYDECARAAHAHGRPEAGFLSATARRARSAADGLTLGDATPLVGDISPDEPPSRTFSALAEIDDANPPGPADEKALLSDGWLRRDQDDWRCLWHVSPDGWKHMPGHGHQDTGGFELHHRDVPIFVDPGRGRYGAAGEAALYQSGATHNTLLIDGQDPYPPNKPYYDTAFRRRVCGPPPSLSVDGGTVLLRHHGYSRFRGLGEVARRWTFTDSLVVSDTVAGRGTREISRILHTALPVRVADGTATMDLPSGGRIDVRADAPVKPSLRPRAVWRCYGAGTTGTAIVFSVRAALPWTGRLIVEHVD